MLVPKNGTVADITPALQKKANLPDEAMQNIRFYEAHGGKVFKELTSDMSVVNFSDYVTIYAEQIPQDEQVADEAIDRAVYAFHFDKEPSKVHGVPFKFVVKPVCLRSSYLRPGFSLNIDRVRSSSTQKNGCQKGQALRASSSRSSNLRSFRVLRFQGLNTLKMVC